MHPEDEKTERYISNLEKHIDSAKDAIKYSSDRFDILIISLCTSALVFSIGFAKDIIDNFQEINTYLLKLSWLFFVIALVLNLISQVSSYYSHKYDVRASKNLIRQKRGKTIKGNQQRIEQICNYFGNTTMILNLASLLLLITGLITTVIFFYNHI